MVDPTSTLATLIDEWCGRRDLELLSIVLPAYMSLNGLADGWAELRAAVRTARYKSKDDAEALRLGEIEAALDRLVAR